MKQKVKFYKNNDGEKFEIVEEGKRFSKIRFSGYNQIVIKHNDFIKIGAVKNPFKPLVYGVGYFGFTSESVTPKRTIEYKYIYEAWKGMLRRCYEKGDKFKSYKMFGVTVDSDWHSFRNFYIWTKSNISNFHIGFELDKDLIGDGRVYSKHNCVFLPKQLNHMIQSQSNGSDTPEGVKILPSGNYQVNISVMKNKMNLGTYDNLAYSVNVYKVAKSMLLEKRALYHLNNKDIPAWIYEFIVRKGWVEKRYDYYDDNSLYEPIEHIIISKDDFIKTNERLKLFKYEITEGNFRDYPNRSE